ncbi:MAG TPA: hypothetical protein VN843_07225, partial [Anaerolineales bacterium]|nr:hypothetical protein [Anaerolineales bacterium]
RLSNESAKFTGYHRRVTFDARFLKALDASISSHRLEVSVRTPFSGADIYSQRGVANYANQALLGQGPSFMQQGGFSTTTGPTSGYQQFRW